MVAVAVYVGVYDRIKETHDAIHLWCEASKLGLRRKVVGDLRRLVGGSVETRNDYYVYAEVKCRPTVNSASG
jgi:hypothetical protein